VPGRKVAFPCHALPRVQNLPLDATSFYPEASEFVIEIRPLLTSGTSEQCARSTDYEEVKDGGLVSGIR